MNVPRPTLAVALAPLLIVAFAPTVTAQSVDTWRVDRVLAQTPELTHDNTGRLPIITWAPFVDERGYEGFNRGEALSPEIYKALGRRGLTQRIPFTPPFVEMAKAIQAAGLPIVFMEGDGGDGPGAEAPDTRHQLPADFDFGRNEPRNVFPCPMIEDGWKVRAKRVRDTIKLYKDAGIHVTAAWLDWEGEPHGGPAQCHQAAACKRCREQIPSEAFADQRAYAGFAHRQQRMLLSKYMAEPILEAFPQCSITNWTAVLSSNELPGYNWWGNFVLAPLGMEKFTAANPVVYGNTAFRTLWKQEMGELPFNQENMDRLYVQQMFRQLSRHEANAQQMGVNLPNIPWVIRYCPDDEDPSIPILSRPLYQEILRHMWLRGADSMQIFNEPRKAHPEICVEEVEDVVRIYDELLAHRDFLDSGVPFQFELPAAKGDGPIWSGLRLKDRALIRTFTLGATSATARVQPWPDKPAVELPAPRSGKTYVLSIDGAQVKVQPE